MEPHVKERIVGAAILVALGVWLIPWVLDGPEETAAIAEGASDDILTAPGDAAPVRTETVELDPAPPASTGSARSGGTNAVEPLPVEATVAETGATAGGAASDASEARNELAEARDAAADARDPAAGAGDPAAGTSDALAATASAVSGSDGQGRPDAAPARTAAPSGSPSVAAREGWSVQLGAFGDIANADQLAARVSTYGYSAYVSEFRAGGGTMHRVRVGGFDSENEAEAAASSLSAHGFPGRVISPE